jgi:hypothetical protein
MNPGFQEGRRPRANAVASLASTGHSTPLGRRPSAGAMQQAHQGAAGRLGPQPMSARQIANVNATHSQAKRVLNQVVQLTKEEAWRENSNAQLRRQMQALPYARYDANRMPANAKTDVTDEYGTPMGQERYVVGQLWVFASTLNDAFGTRKYWVYNTKTKVLVSFEPEYGIAVKNRTYMSEKDRFRNVAAGTGVVGGYLENGFIGVSAGMLTGGVLYEVGALAAISTAVRAYYVRAVEGAATRVLVDLTTQFGVGTVTGKGTWSQRAQASFLDINWVATLGAAAVNTEGLRWYAKLLAAFGSAAGTNAFTVKLNNQEKYHSVGHLVNLHDDKESKDFVINIIAGTAFDQLKEYGAPILEKVMRTPNTAGMLIALKHHRVLPKPNLKVVDQSMVATISYHIGATLETIKKTVENHFADEAEQAADKKAALQRKPTMTPAKK